MEIQGLDDENEFIFISHISDKETKHKIPLENARKKSSFISGLVSADDSIINNQDNPIVIELGTRQAFDIVVKYLQDDKEYEFEFSKPLPRHTTLDKVIGPFVKHIESIKDLERNDQCFQALSLSILARHLDINKLWVLSGVIPSYYFSNVHSHEEFIELRDIMYGFKVLNSEI